MSKIHPRTKEYALSRIQYHNNQVRKYEELLERWKVAPPGVGHPEGVRYKLYMILKEREGSALELARELGADYRGVVSRINELKNYGYIECTRTESRGNMNSKKFWRAKECALPAAESAEA